MTTRIDQLIHARRCLESCRTMAETAKSKGVRRDAREGIEFWGNKVAMLSVVTGWSTPAGFVIA